MSFTLVSSTDSQESLNAAASENWRAAPVPPPVPAVPGEIPASLPQKQFNEVREEEIREKKEAGPEILQGEEERSGKPGRNGYQKRLDKLTKNWKTAESRRIAAESRVAELESRLGNGAAQPASDETQSGSETHPQQSGTAPTDAPRVRTERETGAHQRYISGTSKYADYADVIENAERSELRISERAAVAIESMRNSEDLVYYLAKNPEVCHELLTNPDSATGRIGELSAELMANPQRITQTQNPRQQHPPQAVDPELQQKFHNHYGRVKVLLNSRADASKIISAAEASGIGISDAVNVAMIEQENGEHILLQLLEKPELRAELNRLSYATAMSRISRISAQLEANALSKRERAAPPEPISPVGGSSSRTGISLDQLSPREYIAARNRQDFLRKREVHAHTVYRDPLLASLSDEELRALDCLTRKLALPAPDGPQNQKESDAATNAIDIECGDVQAAEVPQNASK